MWQSLEKVQDLLESLGWILNLGKSQVNPVQSIVFLGYRIDLVSRKLFLTVNKITKLRQCVQHFSQGKLFSIREIIKLVCIMAVCIPAVPWAQFHMREMQTFFATGVEP